MPNFFNGTGDGALIPIVPLFAHQLGASLATAALAAAMLAVGQLLSNVPSGWLVGRIGERRAMYTAAGLSGSGAACCLSAVNVGTLSAGVFLVGTAAAVFNLARHSYVTVAVPFEYRGRGLSLLAGANRLGVLVGPFLSAATIKLTGDIRPAFGIVVLTSIATVVVLRFFARDEDPLGAENLDRIADDPDVPGIWETLRTRSGTLLRVGLSAGLINTMRTSREIMVPLVGLVLGLHPADIALVVGTCAAVDFALFYVGGQIMDRYGRLSTALPTMVGFAIAHVVLGLAHDLPDSFAWYVGAAVVLSIGNGLTSGIVSTMGSDLADQRAPAAFLSSWRMTTDIGPTTAPFAISAITGLFSLAAASFVMGGTALVGAMLLLRYVPRYLPRQPRGGR